MEGSVELWQMPLWQIPALMAGGVLCGIINALSGGGSFVTLPLLLMIGLPPQVANATNRIAIALQCASGVATYHKRGVRPWREVLPLSIPMSVGSFLGAYLAAHVDEDLFRKAAAVLFLIMIATIFVDTKRWQRPPGSGHVKPLLYPLFFLLGIYGGFLQAGQGTILIALLVLGGGYDVVRGNALKFFLTLVFIVVSLVVYADAGQIRWIPGLVLAAGSMLGGHIGARLVMAKGSKLVQIFVVLSAIAAIVKLLTMG